MPTYELKYCPLTMKIQSLTLKSKLQSQPKPPQLRKLKTVTWGPTHVRTFEKAVPEPETKAEPDSESESENEEFFINISALPKPPPWLVFNTPPPTECAPDPKTWELSPPHHSAGRATAQ